MNFLALIQCHFLHPISTVHCYYEESMEMSWISSNGAEWYSHRQTFQLYYMVDQSLFQICLFMGSNILAYRPLSLSLSMILNQSYYPTTQLIELSHLFISQIVTALKYFHETSLQIMTSSAMSHEHPCLSMIGCNYIDTSCY